MLWREGALHEDTVQPFDLADRGLLLGDGVFDTALALGGRVVEEEAHLARLGAAGRRSASRSISPRPGRRCGRWRRAIRAPRSAPP